MPHYTAELETDSGPQTIEVWNFNPEAAALWIETHHLPCFGGRIVSLVEVKHDPNDDDEDEDDEPGPPKPRRPGRVMLGGY